MVFVDAIGNQYIGNCIFSNADINNPNTDYFQAENPANWNSEMISLFTGMGVNYSSLSANLTTSGIMYRWTPTGDTTASVTTRRFETGKGTTSYSRMYSNTGVSLINLSGTSATASNFFTVCGGGDGKSIAMFNVSQNANRTLAFYEFWYQGELTNVNTQQSGYYSADIINRSICIYARSTAITTATINHYIVSTSKSVLTTVKAEYGINCSNGAIPTYNVGWGTDLWVFDNNSTLQFPVIGRARNLLLGVGNLYQLGRPTRFGSNLTMPDGGYNCWLPVAIFAGKTLFMRCYSSSLV